MIATWHEFFIDKSGIFRLVNADNILRYDGIEPTIIPIPHTYPAERSVQDMNVDDDGRVWLGNNRGIMRYDGIEQIIYGTKEGFAFTYNDEGIVCVAFDSTGKARDLSPWNPNWIDGNTRNKFTSSNLSKPDYGEFGSIAFSSDGSVWFGAYKYNFFSFIYR